MSTSLKFGITRDLSMRYAMLKEKLNKYNKSNNNNIINDLNANEKANSHLLSSNDKIELANYNYSERYMETYEKCNDLLREFEIEFNKLKEEQQKYVIPNFNDTESKLISQNIQMISKTMTEKLQKCKQYSNELKNILTSSDLNENIKINMYQNLLNRLAETSKSLQTNEEIYIKKYQELNGCEDNIINTSNANPFAFGSMSLDNNSFETNQTLFNFNSNKKQNERYSSIKARNKDLDQIITTVNDLHKIFDEVANMVIYQGTILDRIDYNIYETRYNIRRGNNQMREAHESLKSGCLRRVNQILIIAILIMGVLILFKFFF